MGAWLWLGRSAGGWAGRNPKPVLVVLGVALWLSQGDACIADDLPDDPSPTPILSDGAPWLADDATAPATEATP